MNIVVTHETGTTGGWLVIKIKQYHIGIGMLADDIKTGVVGGWDEFVVGIHKLQILACSHLDTGITGHTQSLMLLAQINHVIGILLECW